MYELVLSWGGSRRVRLAALCHATYGTDGFPHAPLPLTDRFTGEVVAMAATDHTDFALLTIANELDLARTAALTSQARRDIRALVAALAAYLPDITTQALADPSLL